MGKSPRSITSYTFATPEEAREGFRRAWAQRCLAQFSERTLDSLRVIETTGEEVSRYEQRKKDALADIVATENEIKRLEGGPAKMTKRWEERLRPARATLERLARRWNGNGS